MIDITRNIVVTAENVEGILFVLHNFKLHESLNTVIAGQTAWIPVDEFDLTPQERWIAAQKRLLRVQDLIDRIELVKGDLEPGLAGRFNTVPFEDWWLYYTEIVRKGHAEIYYLDLHMDSMFGD